MKGFLLKAKMFIVFIEVSTRNSANGLTMLDIIWFLSGKTKRKSMAVNSVENVLTLLKMRYNVNVDHYFLHINYTSGIPIDGPSAGVAMFCALYSAIFNKVIPGNIAMTGEISIRGEICPVGGVYEKVMAAKEAGIKKVFIPKDNMQDLLNNIDIKIVPVDRIEQVIVSVFDEEIIKEANSKLHA